MAGYLIQRSVFALRLIRSCFKLGGKLIRKRKEKFGLVDIGMGGWCSELVFLIFTVAIGIALGKMN